MIDIQTHRKTDQITIKRARNNVPSFVSVPGSKSIAIRTLIISTYLREPLVLLNIPDCEDVKTLIEAMQIIGFKIKQNGDKIEVIPQAAYKLKPAIYIKDSATALRLLAIRLAGWKGMEATIKLSPQLIKRPVKPLIDLINAMGGEAFYDGLSITISGVEGLVFNENNFVHLAASDTSQLLSGVLLNLPVIRYEAEVIPDSVSSGYVDLTLLVIKDFGVSKVLSKEQKEYLNPKEYIVEPDFSSVCCFWALGCLLHRPIGIETTTLESKQPDFQFLNVLKQMGAEIDIRDKSIAVSASQLNPITIDMKTMPDQVPTLSVLSLFTREGETVIQNIEHLRYKESDRITALLTELRKIGADLEYKKGVLIIKPLRVKEIHPLTLNGYNDHRLVMSFSLLQCLFPQIHINDKKAVKKSFPCYFQELEKIIHLD